jgi:hypothetical protein
MGRNKKDGTNQPEGKGMQYSKRTRRTGRNLTLARNLREATLTVF